MVWDYCSVSHSAQVEHEAEHYFLEVFNGFDVPINPTKCPLFPLKLKAIHE